MDIRPDYGNIDVMLDEGNTNSTKRELDCIINGPEGWQDLQSLPN